MVLPIEQELGLNPSFVLSICVTLGQRFPCSKLYFHLCKGMTIVSPTCRGDLPRS